MSRIRVYRSVYVYVCMGPDSYSKLTEDFGLAEFAGSVHLTFLFSYVPLCLCDLGIILPKNQTHSVS